MTYLGRKIKYYHRSKWKHRHDNCGEVEPRLVEWVEYMFEGSMKVFYTLSEIKTYIRKLKRKKK